MTFTVYRRFRGPAESGNGGYVSGMFASAAGFGPTTVTLRTPPPLDVVLDVSVDNGLGLLTHGDTIVAEAAPAHDTDADLPAVPLVSTAEARAAETLYAGLAKHPFPECFVCGPTRAEGDGMRLFPGRLGDGRSACVWQVTDDLAGRPEFVWAALDCPGGWAAPIEGRPMVLGRMTAHVTDTPSAGEECVVMGYLIGGEGRKTYTATTVYRRDRVMARARATWITVKIPG